MCYDIGAQWIRVKGLNVPFLYKCPAHLELVEGSAKTRAMQAFTLLCSYRIYKGAD